MQSVIRNEIFYTSYSYPFFHLSMALGLMFITTQLTRWFAPIVSSIYSQHYDIYICILIVYFSQEYQIIDFDKSWATVALKLACSWACGFIYLFFLLMPDKCCCSIFSVFVSGSNSGSDMDPMISIGNGNGLMRRNGSGGRHATGEAEEDAGSNADTFMTAATLVDHDYTTSAPATCTTTRSTLGSSSVITSPGVAGNNNSGTQTFTHM